MVFIIIIAIILRHHEEIEQSLILRNLKSILFFLCKKILYLKNLVRETNHLNISKAT